MHRLRLLPFHTQLNLVKVGEDGDTSNYIHNTEWSMVKLHAQRNVVYYSCCAEPYPDITYTVQIRRKPLFYVFNMILPCFIITLVALLGFYIPSDSGEKVSMGITTLLSMTVFLMLVAENMPPTSDVLPLVGQCPFGATALCFYSCCSYAGTRIG
jgi:nicotinic acetylcholine receptor